MANLLKKKKKQRNKNTKLLRKYRAFEHCNTDFLFSFDKFSLKMNGFGVFVAHANIVTNRVTQLFTMRKPQFSQN